jgi:uncharacterized protein YjiS (DUF1127 family)
MLTFAAVQYPLRSKTMFARIFKGLAARYQDWREREQAYRELSALDDRSLADIGISRSEIPYILAQRPARAEPAAVPPSGAPIRGFRHAA